ncbi:MAG: bifunctional diguanylate cyclase/phosphodiesterase [Defluviitaleaceae bacterium]|nr:bifunctional diguanylate cyclase/phosphodiesterase [Defluviitaleaceae bacterium]
MSYTDNLILEGVAKYTYVYDLKTDTFTFNEAFKNLLALDGTVVEDGTEWLSTIIMDNAAVQEMLQTLAAIKAGKKDALDIKVRIFDDVCKNLRWLRFCGKSDGAYLAGSISEITEEEKRYKLNKLIVQGSSTCIFVFDLTKDSYEFSMQIHELIDIHSRKFKNGRDVLLSHILPADHAALNDALDKIISGSTDDFKVEVRVKGYDGTPVWVAFMGKATIAEPAGNRVIAGSIINLQQLTKFSEHMRDADNTAKASGLPNRAAFLREASQMMLEDNDNFGGNGGFVVLIDIDNFLALNSIHGLHLGDKIMAEYGNVLATLKRDSDVLYHFGNDLFAICSHGQEKTHAKWLCDTITAVTGNGILVDGTFVKMTVSIGVAEYVAGEAPSDILVNAELALSRAKKHKDSVEYYRTDYRDSHIKQVNLEAELLKSITAEFAGFEVFYQPIFSVAHNIFAGAEALLRWRNEEGKIVSPMEVIPALQNLGVFHQVESWIFSTAAAQCAVWKKMTHNEDFTMNINMSPQRAVSGSIADEVVGAMESNSLNLSNIYLELTEESVVVAASGSDKILEDLQNLGTRIALDDFGTGYSSLGHLRHLPICKIKIDKSFVNDIETDEIGRSLLGALVEMSHIMNYVVCAEGVETLEQARILAQMGVEYLQGFYFSKPIPAQDMERDFLVNVDDPEAFAHWHDKIWGGNKLVYECGDRNQIKHSPEPYLC